MTSATATRLGFGAVLLWSLLAVLTTLTAPVPPFQLAAMTFAIGGLSGLAFLLARGQGLRVFRGHSPWVWLLGVGGLFGYHALYFTALRLAPPAEASLIAYLWPLLIVVFASFLPGHRLRLAHLAGALAGFAGAGVIILGTGGFSGQAVAGYLAAFACALIWSSYSVLSRLAGTAPTALVAMFCLATAALSLPLHLAFETTVWPPDWLGMTAVVLLGLGPLGAGFFLWDIGVKRGDVALLGVSSYAAPVLSTLVMVFAGQAQLSPALAIGAALVTAGAWIAARSYGKQQGPAQ